MRGRRLTMNDSRERALTFDCCGDLLIGVLHAPASLARDVGVLIVVGGPQYRIGSHRQFVLMARTFAAAGIAVFRFDYRGMGDSAGKTRSFENIDADIKAAIDTFMAAQPALTGVVLWGLCDAASAALMYCADEQRLRGLVLVNPWVRTEGGEARAYLRHYYAQRLLQRSFWHTLLLGDVNPLRAIREFIATIRSARARTAGRAVNSAQFIDRMLAGLMSCRLPVLILISDRDLTAQAFKDLVAAEPRWRAAVSSPRVRLERLVESDHTFSTRVSQMRATGICLDWLLGLSRAMPGPC